NDNSVSIYIYLNTDSVIGNRCFFATPRCTLQVNAAATTTSGSNLLKPYPTTDTTLLPSTIATALSGAAINVAATDIRPEDGRFAAMRALTPCGTQIGSTQDYGLGYQTGTAGVGTSILENSVAGSGSFHVYDFNL